MTTDADRPSDRVQPTPLTWQGWLRVWALWLVLTTIGGLAGLGLAAYLEGFAVVSGWLPWEIQTGIALTAAGAGMGFGQWLLLRRWVRQAAWWVPATALGQAAGWAMAGALSLELQAEPLIWVVSGLAQWLLLQRWTYRAWWWLPAALVVGGSQMILNWTGYWGLVSDVSGWALHATISGAALWAMLQRGVRPAQARGSVLARVQGGGAAVRYLRYASMAVVGLVGAAYLLLLAAGLALGLLMGGGDCGDLDPMVEVSSPQGRYTARSTSRLCGGAASSQTTRVSLYAKGLLRPQKPGIVLMYSGRSTGVKMVWKNERNLLIEHNCTGFLAQRFAWRDVTISYQAAERFYVRCGEDYREVPSPTQRQRELIAAIEARMAAEADSTLGTEGRYVVLTAAEAEELALQWVGSGYSRRRAPDGRRWLIGTRSTAGTVRQYIGPDAVGNERSSTGVQVIFQTVPSHRSSYGLEEAQRRVRVDISDIPIAELKEKLGRPKPPRHPFLSDSFDMPAAGSLPQSSPDPGRFYAGYEDGEYVIRLTKPAKGTLARVGLPGIHTDVELGIDARLARGTDDAVIVLGCRVNPDYGEEYRLRIDPSRARFTLDQWIDGEATDTYWYYHGVIPGHWTNRVRLFCGRELNVYLNHEWGLSAIPDLPPGADRMTFSPEGGIWIGVEVVSDSAANVEARFDNLEVASRAVR